MLHRSRLSHEQINHFRPDLDLDAYDALYGRDTLDVDDELRVFPFLRNSQAATRKWTAQKDQGVIMPMVLIIVPKYFQPALEEVNLCSVVKEHVQTRECAVLQHDVVGRMFLARQPSTMFDARQALSWIEYCDHHHNTLCLSSNSEAHGIKLLNCNTLTIEVATVESQYVALSYVWGQSDPVENYVVQDDHDRRVLPSAFPKVVANAICVTKSLGYQYLWVDKLCIDQHNSVEKQLQIPKMDVIYEKAQLTIIAAAGKDESHGLPGTSRKRTSWPETVSVGGHLNVVWTAKDPHYAIRQSTWSSRGWTFQEAVLSRRRLVFLEDQVYFECNAMNCYESLISPLDLLHVENKTQMDDAFRAGVFDRNERLRFGQLDGNSMPRYKLFPLYLSSIEQYTARNLRFDSDSYIALAGVMRRFARRKRPIYEVYGLPYLGSSQHERIDTSFSRSLMWFHTTDCWEGSDTPRRRPNFPSWSWAGWSGRIKYHGSGERSTSLIRRIELVNATDGEAIFLSLFGSNTGYGLSPYTRLKIEALIIPTNMLSYESSHGKSGFRSWVIIWQGVKYEAQLHLSQGANSENSFAQYLRAEQGNRWRCVLIGCIRKVSGVMILKRDEHVNRWMRVGLFSVYKSEQLLRDSALFAQGPEVFEIE
jgi:hypothetical protein